MVTSKIYEEFADFLAKAAPTEILSYRPSEKMQNRYETLVFKKKEGLINSEETSELEHYFMLEHIFRLAKIRAALPQTA